MKEQFVTYDIALKLKELGFNEKCLGFYGGGFKSAEKSFELNNNDDATRFRQNNGLKAPLWQQAIDWLKLSHNICVTQTPSIVVDSWIVVTSDSKTIFSGSKEQSILKAIELCKKK